MDEEEMGLRYLKLYGYFGNYSFISERKKIDCLNKLKYLSPEEYHKFKQIKNEQHIKKKN